MALENREIPKLILLVFLVGIVVLVAAKVTKKVGEQISEVFK